MFGDLVGTRPLVAESTYQRKYKDKPKSYHRDNPESQLGYRWHEDERHEMNGQTTELRRTSLGCSLQKQRVKALQMIKNITKTQKSKMINWSWFE